MRLFAAATLRFRRIRLAIGPPYVSLFASLVPDAPTLALLMRVLCTLSRTFLVCGKERSCRRYEFVKGALYGVDGAVDRPPPRFECFPSYLWMTRQLGRKPRIRNRSPEHSAFNYTCVFNTEPKRIRVVDRVTAGIPIEIESAGDANGVFLGERPR